LLVRKRFYLYVRYLSYCLPSFAPLAEDANGKKDKAKDDDAQGRERATTGF